MERDKKTETQSLGIDAVAAFQKAFERKEMFFQFLDFFPYPIEIFAPDGTTVYVNQAMLNQANAADRDQVVGHFNVLNDPVSNDVLGLREYIGRAFRGENQTVSDVRVPYEDTGARYEKKDENFDQVVYMDINSFPLRGEGGEIAYIVMIFQTKNMYKGKREIVKAQEYMEKNWLEGFDLKNIAKAVNLSPYHFARLFKQYSNETPFYYYKKIKVQKLKEKLLDPNLNVTEAFAACGVDYNGRYAKIFESIAGISPKNYKEQKLKMK